MNEEYIDIQVYDGDDKTKYIKYEDMINLIEKIKIKQDERDKEIERLNKKIEQYENPEDMTLMFMWCDEKAKDEIKRLNNIINEANKILSNILVVSDWEHKGKYRPVKNTTSQEVYKSVCMLYGILKTPYRSDYGSLQELKGSDSNVC